ncbi:MAG: MBL fold metallo-hydrolase [Betaproteobacteria bacterium]|nr:MBL fold metallo-hydrolase [Betaproteobacteria bacterium]
MNPEVKAFFDAGTWTLTYVAWDPDTRDAVVIDAVLDYDPAPSRVSTRSLDEVEHFIRDRRLQLHWILDTHAHADHLTGSQEMKTRFPDAKVAIGERIREVQAAFKPVFNLAPDFPTDGSQFDRLLQDGEMIEAGALRIRIIATPGHTPACVSFLVGDAVFTGDTLFMPDYGVGRCDFPSGSAETLFDSITGRLYTLPDETRVFVGHDYQPGGREVLWQSTIGEEKLHNVQLPAKSTKEAFVQFRQARDKRLNAPRLLYPSLQFNINAGRLPAPEGNGMRYLKIPFRS